ncbi:MAG: glycogen synthase [Spirochaetaceae bacterium]|nr:MAG: glycogen synthase [Spirochaetaceae bacterium]
MRILMISSESVPFAKSGGLADAVSALAATLRRQGHDVRVLLPRYGHINTSILQKRTESIPVPCGESGEHWVGMYQALLDTGVPERPLPVYFVDHEGLFGRSGIYTDPNNGDYPDNCARFALLSRSAFQLCRLLDWIPDIMHAHDWPAATNAVYLRHLENTGAFANTASVLTIHNLGYQGVFPRHDYLQLGLTPELYEDAEFEFFGQVNFLKAGIYNADMLVAVSKRYAEEIQQPEFGFELDGLLRQRSDRLHGILNGIDERLWDPEADPYLSQPFSVDNLSGKQVAKREVWDWAGFPETELKANPPLIGLVTRLVHQKGMAELFHPEHQTLERIVNELGAYCVLIGNGEPYFEQAARELSERNPRFFAQVGFEDRWAHRIEAGSDFFLMASRYEPCGLNQMYSLRYGSIPIVTRTGGLADSVRDAKQHDGTGFFIEHPEPTEILNAVERALRCYRDEPERLSAIRERGMRQRFHWEDSAKEYVRAYRSAIARKRADQEVVLDELTVGTDEQEAG